MDARIDEGPQNGSFSGQRFRMQPENTFSFAFLYDRELEAGYDLSASLRYSWQSKIYFDDAFQPNEPISGLDLTQSSYGLLNAQLAFAKHGKDWALDFWGENLTDREYLLDAGNGGVGFGMPTFIAAPPRTYGIGISWKF